MKLFEINKVKSYLCKRDYIFKKVNLTFDELEKSRKDYNQDVKNFKVYLDKKNKFYLPKFY